MSQDAKTHVPEVVIKVAIPLVSALVKKTALDSVIVHAKGLAVGLVHHAADLVAWDVPIAVQVHASVAAQVRAQIVVCFLVC